MKRIIFLSFLNVWSMEDGKGAPSFKKTIEAYINAGWNVTLVNPNYCVGTSPVIEGLKNITFNPFFFPYISVKKVGILTRALHSIQGSLQLYLIGKKLINKYQEIDCIYAYEVNAAVAAKKLSEEFGIPLVTRFQGTILAPMKDTMINRLRFYPHFKALSIKANLSIMTDDGTHGDQVLRRLKNKSEIIKFWRNGVDITKSSLVDLEKADLIKEKCNIGVEDKVLLTVSRLASWKRIDRSINALSSIVKINPNIKLVIVGDGDERGNLTKQSEELGLTKSICFVGAVKQSEIEYYMNIADIFISMYDLSNVGNPLLEAMSCGKPIITLDVGDTKSLIKNNSNGILLKKSDINLLPAKVLELLNDNNFSKKIGENAKKTAQQEFWSWDERMDAELKIVYEMLQRNSILKKD